jgi:hypothetical protein
MLLNRNANERHENRSITNRWGEVESKMGERTPNPESEERPDTKPRAGDAAARSAAEEAREHEREMKRAARRMPGSQRKP